jgi:chemotaxis protein CheZ
MRGVSVDKGRTPDGNSAVSLVEMVRSEINKGLSDCSFQDITGQRIKKVVEAIKAIEEELLDLLVSAGVKIKGKEQGKDSASIQADAQRTMHLLHGPQEGASQESVDSLLEDLGL